MKRSRQSSLERAVLAGGMRACHTTKCPVYIVTQKPHLMFWLIVDQSAERLMRFFETSTELMKLLARACGHRHLRDFDKVDLITWPPEMSELAGITYGGVGQRGG